VFDDKTLYRNIAERVSHGEDYYTAANAEHRAHSYPTTPAQVFREPTMSWWLALLGFDPLRQAALIGLAVATVMAARTALERWGLPPSRRIAALAVLVTGLAIIGGHQMYFLHEAWAAMFIALSLSLYRADRWAPSVALGVIACLFRELALPYLMAMAAFAVLERRWRELAGWIVGCTIFASLFAAHLSLAASLRHAGDAPSQGWLAFRGLPFVLATARSNVALYWAPGAVVALAVGLSLIGLFGSRNPVAARAALIVGGYMCAFLVVGRADNFYWGYLYAPILPLGVVLAPPALFDLWQRAMPQLAVRSTAVTPP
jgi:hypothetical protein